MRREDLLRGERLVSHSRALHNQRNGLRWYVLPMRMQETTIVAVSLCVPSQKEQQMEIGPLEYLVIGLEDDRFTCDILPELNAIQQNGLIRVVDLLFVSKDADGIVTVQEVSELREEEQQVYANLARNLTGMLTAQDIERLAGGIPAGSEAIVVLLEHVWTLGLAQAVRQAGGILFTGGMVSPDVLAQVSAELAAAKEEHHA